jgi:hypothetical protein
VGTSGYEKCFSHSFIRGAGSNRKNLPLPLLLRVVTPVKAVSALIDPPQELWISPIPLSVVANLRCFPQVWQSRPGPHVPRGDRIRPAPRDYIFFCASIRSLKCGNSENSTHRPPPQEPWISLTTQSYTLKNCSTAPAWARLSSGGWDASRCQDPV